MKYIVLKIQKPELNLRRIRRETSRGIMSETAGNPVLMESPESNGGKNNKLHVDVRTFGNNFNNN